MKLIRFSHNLSYNDNHLLAESKSLVLLFCNSHHIIFFKPTIYAPGSRLKIVCHSLSCAQSRNQSFVWATSRPWPPSTTTKNAKTMMKILTRKNHCYSSNEYPIKVVAIHYRLLQLIKILNFNLLLFFF